MCGIVAASGKRNVIPILMDGLQRLEYRGYDSAGIAVLENNAITRIRKQGKVGELYKEIEKNKKVSIIEPKIDEVIGAINHALFLKRWKISISISWATKKAVPEPMAILIDIISWKFVETNIVNKIPTTKPI